MCTGLKSIAIGVLFSIGVNVLPAADNVTAVTTAADPPGLKTAEQAKELLTNPDVSAADAIKCVLIWALQSIDKRIKEQTDRLQEIQSGNDRKEIDVEVARLKALTEKRVRVFEVLKEQLAREAQEHPIN